MIFAHLCLRVAPTCERGGGTGCHLKPLQAFSGTVAMAHYVCHGGAAPGRATQWVSVCVLLPRHRRGDLHALGFDVTTTPKNLNIAAMVESVRARESARAPAAAPVAPPRPITAPTASASVAAAAAAALAASPVAVVKPAASPVPEAPQWACRLAQVPSCALCRSTSCPVASRGCTRACRSCV
jgi:hypothetical protein